MSDFMQIKLSPFLLIFHILIHSTHTFVTHFYISDTHMVFFFNFLKSMLFKHSSKLFEKKRFINNFAHSCIHKDENIWQILNTLVVQFCTLFFHVWFFSNKLLTKIAIERLSWIAFHFLYNLTWNYVIIAWKGTLCTWRMIYIIPRKTLVSRTICTMSHKEVLHIILGYYIIF